MLPQFVPGDPVKLVLPISDMEKDLIKRGNTEFTVLRMDKTHGYAVCENEGGTWHIHHEALQRPIGPGKTFNDPGSDLDKEPLEEIQAVNDAIRKR